MAIGGGRRRFISTLGAARIGGAARIAIVLAFTAVFTVRGAGQDFVDHDFMAPSGAPAEVFPKPRRPVADIISPIWHGESERDAAGESRQVVRLLGIKPGMTVADVGTGTGYMLPFLSKAVGPNGKVIAEDIAQDFLDHAKAKAASLGNVSLILGNETDPKLPAGSLDRELVLDVYHHFDYPDKMLANLGRALKPGGRLVIVDFYKKDRPDHIRLERDDVVKEIESNSYHLISTHDRTGNNQYMIVFEKK
jgi:SAM-dependent methyltransferase